MARVEVITGPERRRRWSEVQKRAIVAESLVAGAVVSDVARRADIGAGQIYRWRKEFRAVADGFAQVLIAPPEIAAAQVAAGEPTIELEFARKLRVRARFRRIWPRRWSRRCRGDDPGSVGGASVVGGRPH